jgi:hypothetical protein
MKDMNFLLFNSPESPKRDHKDYQKVQQCVVVSWAQFVFFLLFLADFPNNGGAQVFSERNPCRRYMGQVSHVVGSSRWIVFIRSPRRYSKQEKKETVDTADDQ